MTAKAEVATEAAGWVGFFAGVFVGLIIYMVQTPPVCTPTTTAPCIQLDESN